MDKIPHIECFQTTLLVRYYNGFWIRKCPKSGLKVPILDRRQVTFYHLNTMGARILNEFKFWILSGVSLVNGSGFKKLDLFECHLVFDEELSLLFKVARWYGSSNADVLALLSTKTGSVLVWSVLVQRCSYSHNHSKRQLFQYRAPTLI